MHSGICLAFHLQFAVEQEWQEFIFFSIRFFLNWSPEMKKRITVMQSMCRNQDYIDILFIPI